MSDRLRALVPRGEATTPEMTAARRRVVKGAKALVLASPEMTAARRRVVKGAKVLALASQLVCVLVATTTPLMIVSGVLAALTALSVFVWPASRARRRVGRLETGVRAAAADRVEEAERQLRPLVADRDGVDGTAALALARMYAARGDFAAALLCCDEAIPYLYHPSPALVRLRGALGSVRLVALTNLGDPRAENDPDYPLDDDLLRALLYRRRAGGGDAIDAATAEDAFRRLLTDPAGDPILLLLLALERAPDERDRALEEVREGVVGRERQLALAWPLLAPWLTPAT